jgi:tRNA modification GTPase
MKSLQGDFSKKINALIDELIRLRVFVEAAIDFPEEEIDFLSDSHVGQQLAKLIQLLQELLANAREGRLLKEGIHLVIAGLPNVGKSTLLNALAEEELAIVTNVPGTTRDLKGETISIDGIPVHVVDTAGIRETDCVVEQEGIKRTFKELKKADCVLHLKAINDNASMESGLSQEILEKDLPVIEVVNKADLCQDLATKRPESLFISAKEGVGISDLKQRIKTLIGVKDLQGEGLILARRRHILALESAQNALITGQKQLKEHKAGELLAEDLKLATDALSEITGGISADQLLGQIFSSFCIGK